MRRLILILGALFSLLPARAVTITANSPAYNWQVLPGSVRFVNVAISGGSSNLVNWTVASTTGGASATFTDPTHTAASSISAGEPYMQINLGPTAGSCSISGSVGSYSVTSTATVTVQAQAVDDTSQTATFLFNVCANTTKVWVVPFYRAAYVNQPVWLQSWVVGNTNQAVTWSITSQPNGGDGTLADTNQRDAVFSASVAGRYTLTATSAADGTKTDTATVFVTGHVLPSYSVTPNLTEPVDCSVDPDSTGSTYVVMPGGTYPTIASVPFHTMAPGSTVAIYNTDNTCLAPTVYHEYFQVQSSGTKTQPIRVCGVPDPCGNLPIIDGQDATSTGNTWMSSAAYGYSAITLYQGGPGISVYGAYNTVSPDVTYNQAGTIKPVAPSYVSIEGLHVRNVTRDFMYTPPGGGAQVAWTGGGLPVGGAACIALRGGAYQVVLGNEFETCENGILADFNATHGWAGFNGAVDIEGNNFHNDSYNGNGSVHQLYIQDWLDLVQFNRVTALAAGALGANLKDRGLSTVTRNNYFGLGQTSSGPTRDFDLVDGQDANDYMIYEKAPSSASGMGYLGNPGDTNCGHSWWCSGDTMGASTLAAWQEAWESYYLYSNISPNTVTAHMVLYNGDHGNAMANRRGVLQLYNNTFSTTAPSHGSFFDTDNAGGDPVYEVPRINAQNNILWSPPGSYPCWQRVNTFVGNFATNLVSPYLSTVTTPINGTGCASQTNDWASDNPTYAPFPNAIPLDNHMGGISAANFIAAIGQPYNSATYVPTTAVAGSALPSGLMPVRFQINPLTMQISARAQPLIIGAADSGPAPVLNSITVTPSSAAVPIGASQQFAAVCNYSDSSQTTCTSSVTWSSGAPGVATITSGGLATAAGAGNATISASLSGVTGTASLSAIVVPTSSWQGIAMQGVSIR